MQPHAHDFTVRPSQNPAPSQVQGGGGGDKPPSRSSRLRGQISLTQRTVPKPVRFRGLPR